MIQRHVVLLVHLYEIGMVKILNYKLRQNQVRIILYKNICQIKSIVRSFTLIQVTDLKRTTGLEKGFHLAWIESV